MDLDDLDFEQDLPQGGGSQEPNDQSKTNDGGQVSDGVSEYLKTIGISDANNIKFENEDGTVENRSWSDLSEDEKLGILKTPNTQNTVQQVVDPAEDLDDSEVNFLNYLRSNNISPEEYTQSVYSQGAQDSQQQNRAYTVDTLSDDELFLADMQLRVKDMTQDELISALDQAKANPDLYQKQIKGLREEYTRLENQNLAEQEAEQQDQINQQYQYVTDQIINSIDNFNSVGNMDIKLSNEDKDQIAELILGQDGVGKNYLQKAFEDPDNIVAASWFLLHGQETFDSIQDYIAQCVKQAREYGYKEGLLQSGNQPQVVINKKPSSNNNKNIASIDDIDF